MGNGEINLSRPAQLRGDARDHHEGIRKEQAQQ
jgi:hypothetical protein